MEQGSEGGGWKERRGNRWCYTVQGEGWWCRVWRETSLSLIPGRLPNSPQPTWAGWVWSGKSSHPPQSPLRKVLLARLRFPRSLEAPAQPELPPRVSRGRQALKALSPHPQGSRNGRGCGVAVGIRRQELGHA